MKCYGVSVDLAVLWGINMGTSITRIGLQLELKRQGIVFIRNRVQKPSFTIATHPLRKARFSA